MPIKGILTLAGKMLDGKYQTVPPSYLQHCRLPVLMQVSKIFWKTQEQKAVVKENKLVTEKLMIYLC